MRSAITYINCLKDLLEDCDAGRLEEDIYRRSLFLDMSEKKEEEKDREKYEAKSMKKEDKEKTTG